MYIYKFNLDISLMKKVSLETSFHFLVLYFIILLVKSKEIIILEKEEIMDKILEYNGALNILQVE